MTEQLTLTHALTTCITHWIKDFISTLIENHLPKYFFIHSHFIMGI